MTSSRLPRRVKVGPVTYTVLTDAAEIKRMSDDQDIDGEWSAFSDHDRLLIGINPAHHDDANRVTLLHELLHCCLRQSGVWPDAYGRIIARAKGYHGGYSVEEATISGTAAPLLAILKANPGLTRWLLGGEA